jgi:hypothetical protein
MRDFGEEFCQASWLLSPVLLVLKLRFMQGFALIPGRVLENCWRKIITNRTDSPALDIDMD